MIDQEEYETIHINKLNLDDLIPHEDPKTWDKTGGAIYLIIGPSGSGKSSIIESILVAKSHFIPVAYVISETEEMNNTFKSHVPPLFVADNKISENIDKIQTRQIVAKHNLENPWIVLVLDDCMNKKTNFRSETEISLFKTSRHKNMMVLISCQYTFDLKPDLRQQCAGFFILKSNNDNDRKKIYNDFMSMVNKNLFEDLMNQLTTDYGCIFVNNRINTLNPLDKIFWFKAPPSSDLQGISCVSKDVQVFNDDRYDPNYDPFKKILKKKFITSPDLIV